MEVGDLIRCYHDGEYAIILQNDAGFILLYWFDTGEAVWEGEDSLKANTEVICK